MKKPTNENPTNNKEREKAIDPLAHLSRQRIYLFSGAEDKTVLPLVGAALKAFYAAFVAENNIRAQPNWPGVSHLFPTDSKPGRDCKSGAPFVSDCDYDAARMMLTHFYGDLQPRNPHPPADALVAFDQTRFATKDREARMATRGYVYVPRACAPGAPPCRLHVALHGCRQTAADVQQAFVAGAGYNEWADTNRIVVLYPQVDEKYLSGNPNRCWDWFGYTGPDWLTKTAPQMRTIVAMIDHLTAGSGRGH